MINNLKNEDMKNSNTKFQVTEELIGKYINTHLLTDVYPVGKIVGIKGKTNVLIQPVRAGENKTEMNMVVGGYSGHTTNNYAQRYDFFEDGEVYEERLSNTRMKNKRWRIGDKPINFYDYNF
jgi:hypothetical protein